MVYVKPSYLCIVFNNDSVINVGKSNMIIFKGVSKKKKKKIHKSNC